MNQLYDTDILSWSHEPVALLRAQRRSELDLDNIIDEIADVGRAEQRELQSRFVVLICHLLKWAYRPDRRRKSWTTSMDIQRSGLARVLRKMPSLCHTFEDDDWLQGAWNWAVVQAIDETGLHKFPRDPVWSIDQILDRSFLPD